jgi:hypothetical protein
MTEDVVALTILLEAREMIIVITIARSRLSSLEDQSDHVHLLMEFVHLSVHLHSLMIQSLYQRRSQLKDRKTHVQQRSRIEMSAQSVQNVQSVTIEETETIIVTTIAMIDATTIDLETETIEITIVTMIATTTDHQQEETIVHRSRHLLLIWHLLQIQRAVVAMIRKRRTTIETTT